MPATLTRVIISAGLVITLATTARAATNVTVTGIVPSVVSSLRSTFTATPPVVPPDGTNKGTLRVTARDNNGDPLQKKVVTMLSNRALLDTITCPTDPATASATARFLLTDGNGQAVCTVTSKTVGISTYTAIVDTVTLVDKPNIDFKFPETGPTVPSNPTTPTTPTKPAPNPVVHKLAIGQAVAAPIIGLLVPLLINISLAILAAVPGLQYLFFSLSPFNRPKRNWGVIRDSITHAPVPGVVVSLYDALDNKLIKSNMTDQTGRFGFLIPKPGHYWVGIKNPLYKEYRSSVFGADQFDADTLSFNIEITAIENLRTAAIKKADRLTRLVPTLNALHLLILLTGSSLTIVLFIQEQSTTTVLLLIFYALLWTLKILHKNDHRQYGLVEDKQTVAGLAGAIIQVTTTDRSGIQSFVHSAISDEQGRFIVLVPPGYHTIIAARQGYQVTQKNIFGEAEDTTLLMQRQGGDVLGATG